MPLCARGARLGFLSTSAAKPRRTRSRCPSWSGWAWTSSAWRRHGSVKFANRSAAWTSPRAAKPRKPAYSTSPLTQLVSAASASGASSPSALRERTVPPGAPRASTARMLFALATLPFEPTVSWDRNRSAVLTNVAAGRAWRATPAGSATVDSELAGTARILGGSGHVFERLAGGRHDGGRDGAFDEGSVHQPDVCAWPVF